VTWTDHRLNAIAGARKDVRLPPKVFAAKVGAKMAAATNACQRPLRMIHTVVASIAAALAAHQAHTPSQSGKNASGRHSTATKGGEINGNRGWRLQEDRAVSGDQRVYGVSRVEPLAGRQVVPGVLADRRRILVDAGEPTEAGHDQHQYGYRSKDADRADAEDDTKAEGGPQSVQMIVA